MNKILDGLSADGTWATSTHDLKSTLQATALVKTAAQKVVHGKWLRPAAKRSL